jgi:hypothetical protein
MQRRYDFGILVELYLKVMKVRLLERGCYDTRTIAGICENDRRMRQSERASQTANQKMENLLSREIPHHFVQHFDEMLSRFLSIAKTLKLSLCFTQRRA